MEPALLIILMKISGLVGSVFTAYKLFQEVFLNKKPRLRDEYKFAKDFLNDIAAVEQRHPYLIEKGYAAISGKESLTAKEIIYLLSQPWPSLSLRQYAAARRYVMFDEDKNRIDYVGKNIDKNKRKCSKIINLIWYYSFFTLALLPLFFASDLFNKPLILIFSSTFTTLAFLYLIEYNKIKKGEQLVERQQLLGK